MSVLERLPRLAEQALTAALHAGTQALSAAREVAEPALRRRFGDRSRPAQRSSTQAPAPPATPPRTSAPPAPPAPPTPPAPAVPRTPEPPPAAAAAAAAEPPAPHTPAASLDEAPAHVDREAVVVAESSDAGAEDGAGAQIRIREPWEGYGKLTAKAINDRLAVESAESLAVVRLYESTHRNRVTVLKEIDRRLAAAG